MAVNDNNEPKSALIVVDMQEDFCEPDGALAVKEGRGVGQIINQLLEYPGFSLKIASRDVHPHDHISFASRHPNAQPFVSSHTIHNPENQDETQTTLLWPDHCVENTPGAQIIPEIDVSKIDLYVSKGADKRVECYSAFGPPFRQPAVSMSNLHAQLQDHGVTHVFCVGLAYDFCVKHTALDAVEHGYTTFVIEDGTKAVMQSDEALEATRKELRDRGVRLIGLNADEVRRLRS